MLKGVILLFAYFERILFYGVDGVDGFDDDERIENKYPFYENNYEYSDSDDSEDETDEYNYLIQVIRKNIAFC
jgi:hypothetical protein